MENEEIEYTTIYSALGYDIDRSNEIESLRKILVEQCDDSANFINSNTNVGYIVSYIDDYMGQVWFDYDKKYICGSTPFYNSSNFFEIENVEALKSKDGLIINGIACATYQNEIPIKLGVIGANIIPALDVDKTYKAQIALFASEVKQYDTIEDWHKINPTLNHKSIIPYCSFTLDGYGEYDTEYLITGVIKSIKQKINKYTENTYYIIKVESLGGLYEVMVGAKHLDKAPEVGQILSGIYIAEAKIMQMYYGYELFKDYKIEKSTNRRLQTINDLYRLLKKSYSLETCYYYSREFFGEHNKTIGQCAITAMLVHDLIGAEIYMISDSELGQHYFNKIDGNVLDLTSEQYDLDMLSLDYATGVKLERSSFKSENCLKRYKLLIENIKEAINEEESSSLN